MHLISVSSLCKLLFYCMQSQIHVTQCHYNALFINNQLIAESLQVKINSVGNMINTSYILNWYCLQLEIKSLFLFLSTEIDVVSSHFAGNHSSLG